MNWSKDFEQINFNPWNFLSNQDQEMRDSDLKNYFNDLNSINFDSPHVLEENVKRYYCDIKKYDNLSLIYVNIRSIHSKFDKFLDLPLNRSNCFNIICVNDTWPKDKDFKNYSRFSLPNFHFLHEGRNSGKKVSGVLIYLKNDIKFKIIKDLSVSDGENKNSKSLLIKCCYGLPSDW